MFLKNLLTIPFIALHKSALYADALEKSVVSAEGDGAINGWRCAAKNSPRITYRFQDLPLCEMARAAGTANGATASSTIKPGLLTRWWNGGSPIQVTAIDLQSEKTVTEICVERLKHRDVEELKKLIEHDFWYSYLTPAGEEARVNLGFMNDTKHMIYAHKTFHTFGKNTFNVVPSAPILLKSEHDLKLTYNVIHHPEIPIIPTPMINKLIWYNGFCTSIIITLLFLAFKSEAFSQSSSGLYSVVLSDQKFQFLTIAMGVGSQLLATMCLLPVIVGLCGSTYSVNKLLLAFCIGYLANGFTVIRLFKFYRCENNLFRTMLSALLVAPVVALITIWHLNLLFTEVGSSRSIPMLKFIFKFLVLLFLVCVPLHYAGGVLSYQYSPKSGQPMAVKDSSSRSYAPLILGLVPFGSLVLPLSRFVEIMFGPVQDSFIYPIPFLVAILTYVAVVAVSTIAAARLTQSEDWPSIPIGIAEGTTFSTFIWLTYLALTKYLLSPATLVEFLTYNVILGLCVGVVTLVVSYLSCEVYYRRFGGSTFLTRPQF